MIAHLLPTLTSPPPRRAVADGVTIVAYAAGHLIGGSIWLVSYHGEALLYAVDHNKGEERHLNGTALEKLVVRPAVMITDAVSMQVRDAEAVACRTVALVCVYVLGGGDRGCGQPAGARLPARVLDTWHVHAAWCLWQGTHRASVTVSMQVQGTLQSRPPGSQPGDWSPAACTDQPLPLLAAAWRLSCCRCIPRIVQRGPQSCTHAPTHLPPAC